MSEAVVKANELKFQGREFWRGASESIAIADVGEIRTPLGKPSWFEAKDRVKAGKVKVKTVGSITIDAQRTSKVDFLANINLAKVFPLGKGSVGYEEVRDHKLELVYMEIETDDMVRAINDSPALREKLKDWGEDARICTSIFGVVTAQTHKRFQTSTAHEAEFTVQGVTIKPQLSASVGGDTTVTFSKGMTFAYGIAKPIWDAPKPKNAKRLLDLRFDNHT